MWNNFEIGLLITGDLRLSSPLQEQTVDSVTEIVLDLDLILIFNSKYIFYSAYFKAKLCFSGYNKKREINNATIYQSATTCLAQVVAAAG